MRQYNKRAACMFLHVAQWGKKCVECVRIFLLSPDQQIRCR